VLLFYLDTTSGFGFRPTGWLVAMGTLDSLDEADIPEANTRTLPIRSLERWELAAESGMSIADQVYMTLNETFCLCQYRLC